MVIKSFRACKNQSDVITMLSIRMSQSSWEITRRAHVQSELVVFHRHHTLVMDWLIPVMRGSYTTSTTKNHENIFFSSNRLISKI